MIDNLNPQQKAASEAPSGPLLIVAGAGTGKTRTLTHRLARFLKEGIPKNKICAITFTNKAAREMADRITDYQLLTANYQPPFIGTFHALVLN